MRDLKVKIEELIEKGDIKLKELKEGPVYLMLVKRKLADMWPDGGWHEVAEDMKPAKIGVIIAIDEDDDIRVLELKRGNRGNLVMRGL